MSKNIYKNIYKFQVITNRSGCLECPHSRCGTYITYITHMILIRRYHECLIIIFLSRGEKRIVTIYLARVAWRDKWFYVQQHSLLGREHACPQYFIFCRVRQATSRNIPRKLTVGGRILCGSGNALRSAVEYIHHVYIPDAMHKRKH